MNVLHWEREVALAHFLDLPYESKCQRLHGHNYYVKVDIGAELNDEGMVIDFTKLKKIVPDHLLVVSKNWVEHMRNGKVLIKKNDMTLYLPENYVYIVNYPNTTVEYLSRDIAEKIAKELKNFKFVRVEIYEDRDSSAEYIIRK